MAKSFLTELEEGEFEGLISPFVALEVYTVGRRELVRHTEKDLGEVEKDVGEAIKHIARMKNLHVFPAPTQSVGINAIFKLAYPLLRKYPGRIVKCRKRRETPNERDHRGLYTVDIVHLATALYAKCDDIATFDKLFKDVDENIGLMILEA